MKKAPLIRVLLVEDDPAEARLIKALLREAPGADYQLKVTHSLAKSEPLLNEHDVVLVALSRPDATGLDAFERFLAVRPRAPVIILSDHNDDSLAVQAAKAGAQDYLLKSDLASPLLARAIRYAIERVRAEENIRSLSVAQAAQARSAEATRRADLLADAGAILASSLDFEETAPQLAKLMLRDLADACVIEVEDTAGIRPRTFESTKGDSGQAALDLVKAGAPCTTLVPLVLRGHRVGTMCLAKAGGALHNYDEIFLIEEIGRRAALAIESARLFKDAQSAVRAREEMMAILSHDLRNPLNVFALTLRALQPAVLGDPRRIETLARADRAYKRMKGLLEDLLDVSRIDEGSLRIDLANADLATTIAEAIELQSPVAAEKGIVLEFLADPIHARFDRERVSQVLTNLLGNALKFTPSGGRVQVECRPRGNQALVTVTDNGPGIPEEHIGHVFDRFWQNETQERRSGIGLGLTIAKGIVEAHGGNIKALNAPGQGACFEFTLPLPREASFARHMSSQAASSTAQ